MAKNPYPIDSTLSEFLESAVAMILASSDSNNQPVITRGFGARVSEDLCKVTVFVTDTQSARFIDNIQQTGQVALNGTRVSDYQSYQVKGIDGQLTELSLKDKRHVEQYCDTLAFEMEKIGLSPQQSRTILQKDNANFVGIQFTVLEVYCQTPGPGAGEPRKSEA